MTDIQETTNGWSVPPGTADPLSPDTEVPVEADETETTQETGHEGPTPPSKPRRARLWTRLAEPKAPAESSKATTLLVRPVEAEVDAGVEAEPAAEASDVEAEVESEHSTTAVPADAPPPGGVDLIRTGTHQIGAGAVALVGRGLESVRSKLPRRYRSVTKKRLALALLVAAVVVLVVVVAAVSILASLLGGPTEVIPATVKPALIENQPGGVGTISPAPQHVASISLDVQGVTAPIQITGVDVFAGENVQVGAPLLQLNPVPFEQNVAQVEATLLQSEAALASARSASGSSTGSGNAYLAVQIPTLEGQVALNQQLLAIANGNAGSITAPIAGYISNVRITQGQIVTPGNTLMQVVDPTEVQVSTGMQLSDLQSISTGDTAVITPSQLPGVHLHGTVVAVSPAAANGGLEGTVVVQAPNLAHHLVPIGSQTFVRVTAPVHAAVSVPALAVLNTELNPAVAVIEDGHVHFQPVVLGASDGDRIQILSGLHRGQQVALTNLQSLTDGSAVKVTSGSS